VHNPLNSIQWLAMGNALAPGAGSSVLTQNILLRFLTMTGSWQYKIITTPLVHGSLNSTQWLAMGNALATSRL